MNNRYTIPNVVPHKSITLTKYLDEFAVDGLSTTSLKFNSWDC